MSDVQPGPEHQETPSLWPAPAVWGLYALLALLPQIVLWIYPLRIPLRYPTGDLGLQLWNHWWIREAFATGQNPYFCPLLFHPFGVPLTVHTLDLVSIAATLPFQWIGGVVLSWKAAFLLNCIWASAAAHALAHRLGAGRLGAIACGVLLANNSYFYVNVRRVDFLSTGNVIFLFYAIAGLVEKPASLKRALLVALGVLLTTFSNLHYLIYPPMLVPAAAIGAFFAGRWRPTRRWLLSFLKSSLVALAICGPIVLTYYLAARRAEGYMGMLSEFPLDHRIRGSADIWQFLLPVWLRALLTGNPIPEEGYRLLAEPLRSFTFALPLSFAVLSIYGWIRVRKGAPPSDTEKGDGALPSRPLRAALLTAIAVCILLGLGPRIKIWTTVDPADRVEEALPAPPQWEGLSIWSPVSLLLDAPILSHIRVWNRGGYFFLLGVAVLAAPWFERGVRATQILVRERAGTAARLLPAIAISLLYLEGFQGFYTVEAQEPPPIYEVLRNHPGQGAVREFPDIGFAVNGAMMYGQTIHHKPIVGGFISRDLVEYEDWLRERPWCFTIRAVYYGNRSLDLTAEQREQFLRTIREDGVQFILWSPPLTPSWMDPRVIPVFLERNRLATPLPGGDEFLVAYEVVPAGSE